MKNILLISGFILSLPAVAQQTTAQDWTHTDCISGNTYNLYNILDSNKVVVMEFEMGCYSCAAASVKLEERKQKYDTTHPGQVKFFIMDYWPGNTCTTVSKFINDSSFSMPGFANCGPDKDYYTLSTPMPMVVIAAGSGHAVYYKKLYFDSTDTQDLTTAIDSAISDIAAGINNSAQSAFKITMATDAPTNNVYVKVYGNRAGDKLEMEIVNLLGQSAVLQSATLSPSGFTQVKLNLPDLHSGLYFVRYSCGEKMGTLRFVAGR